MSTPRVSEQSRADDASYKPMVLQRRDIPEAIRSLSTLASPDYVDLFTAWTSESTDRSPEQWARAVLEEAPLSGRNARAALAAHGPASRTETFARPRARLEDRRARRQLDPGRDGFVVHDRPGGLPGRGRAGVHLVVPPLRPRCRHSRLGPCIWSPPASRAGHAEPGGAARRARIYDDSVSFTGVRSAEHSRNSHCWEQLRQSQRPDRGTFASTADTGAEGRDMSRRMTA